MSKSDELKTAWDAAIAETGSKNSKAARRAEDAYWAAVEEEEAEENGAASGATVSLLDELRAAAYRAEAVNARPASQKQISYLAALMAEAGKDLTVFDSNLVLTSAVASQRIDALINR